MIAQAAQAQGLVAYTMDVLLPSYICPMCRQQLKNPPIQVYLLKTLVNNITKLVDKDRNEGEHVLGLGANQVVRHIWDRFLPVM